MVRSIRILAQGLFILFLIMWGWIWWMGWSGDIIHFGQYIQAVYVLLFLMAGCTISDIVERSLTYGTARNQSRTFMREVAGALGNRNLDQAIAIAKRYPRSPSAKVVAAGLATFQAATPLLSDTETIETAQLALKRSAARLHVELKRGLTVLASIATTAPLVGAFGTVLGIMNSFQGCSGAKLTCMAYTFEGLAGALLPTALSLTLGVLTQLPHLA